MRDRRSRERIEVITAFKGGHNAPLAGTRRKPAESLRHPFKVFLTQAQGCQWIGLVRIETRGQEQKFGCEFRQRRKNSFLIRCTKACAACARREWHVYNISGLAALRRQPGAGIQWKLVCRRVEEIWIIEENILRAISVVDIEIHDRNPREAVNGTDVKSAHGDIVEQAKSHWAHALGMMARRTDGAESVVDPPRHHGVRRCGDRARSAQGGVRRPRRNDGIRIDSRKFSGPYFCRQDFRDMHSVVSAEQRFELDAGGFHFYQLRKRFVPERG